jgi:predicted metalloprotease with PDZ domain
MISTASAHEGSRDARIKRSNRKTIWPMVSLALCFLIPTANVHAQTPMGPIRLEVDATQAPQKILHAHLQIPVKAGPLLLHYPEWIPGEHMPDGPIIEVAGLYFSGGGKTIPWRRDLVDMFAFHLDIPDGVTMLDVKLDFLLSAPSSGYSSGASATAFLDVISWNQVLFYPDGYAVRDLTVVPSLKLPPGWKFGTALPGQKQNGDTIDFSPVSMNQLVDSPVLAGRYFRAIELTPGQTPPHEMDIAADNPADLAMSPQMQMEFRHLVDEAGTLFGSRHYRDYHFLVTLSDDVAHFGLEHHESSDDRTDEHSLIDPSQSLDFADLLPHEFVHSWNGKFRRPADLATPDYHTPMKDDLLWVYEGLTEYLGEVLTARSGLFTPQQAHEALAGVDAVYGHRPGREWRPLQDTADAAPFLYNAGLDWSNWRRGVDFYQEGELLWLDVDTTIRGLTNDKKSIDDFCKLFHGGPGGEPELKTYTFDDIVTALNTVAPYDWHGFLRTRLDSVAPNTPDEAIGNSGWKLVYNEQPNEIQANLESLRRRSSYLSSIGMIVADEGWVEDVVYDSPAYKAGLGPGMKIAAVNQVEFSTATLKNAITDAKSGSAPIQLVVANGQEYRTYSVDYHGGLRYPHLERENSRPDYLGEIFQAKSHE